MQLKGNQGDVQADVRAFVADQDIEYIDEFISVDGDHGRIEERSYRVYDVPDYLIDTHQWPHLGAFVHVVSKRRVGETTSRQPLRAAVPPVKMPLGKGSRHADPWPLGNREQLALVSGRCDERRPAPRAEGQRTRQLRCVAKDRIGHHQGK